MPHYRPFYSASTESRVYRRWIGKLVRDNPYSLLKPIPIFTIFVGLSLNNTIFSDSDVHNRRQFASHHTPFLKNVAAGLFSRAVWYFENNAWDNIIGSDASETGSDPGSYDIGKSVWHVNRCNPELNGGGGWGIINALLGWTNSATYGSVISYNLY